MKMDIGQIMRLAPVIPVLVVENVADAIPIAEALVAGGLPALEVTLRTEAALEVIFEMSKVEGAIVGAGTVLNTLDLDRALNAGAKFIVSPGISETLGRAVIESDIAYLPGTACASDIMRGMDLGLSHFKFFPAATSGGVPALKALSAPFFDAKFCPTGGIRPSNALTWLEQPSVVCVGGTWLVPPGDVDVVQITNMAREASALIS